MSKVERGISMKFYQIITLFLGCILLLSPVLSTLDINFDSLLDDFNTSNGIEEQNLQENGVYTSYPKIEEKQLDNSQQIIDGAPNLNESSKKWLYFFDSEHDYRTFTQSHDFVREYPNLKAILVEERVETSTNFLFSSAYSVGYRYYTLPSPLAVNQSHPFTQSGGSIQDISTPPATTISAMNLGWLHTNGYNGTGINIGIIDTGIDSTHMAFTGKIKAAASFRNESYGLTPGISATNTTDYSGHGTHVASLAAGHYADLEGGYKLNSSAPGANLYIAAIDNVTSPTGRSTTYAMVSAFEWMMSQPVDIINFSYGSTQSSRGQDPLVQIVNKIVAKGIIVVVAAGNSGSGTHTIDSPGIAEQVITVAAYSHQSPGIASFSSRGPTLEGYVKPDISAPGVNIVGAISLESTDPQVSHGYNFKSGTSMASPHTAGAIASILQAIQADNNTYNPGSIKAAISLTAKKIAGYNSLTMGAGLIDANKSYTTHSEATKDSSNLAQLLFAQNSLSYPFEGIQQQIAAGSIQHVFIPVFSSHPSSLSFSLTSSVNLNSTIIYSDNASSFSQNIIVRVKIPENLAVSSFSASLNISSQGISEDTVVTLQYYLLPGDTKRIGIDLVHTNWIQDGYNPTSQYVSVIKWGLSNGYGFSELIGSEITQEYLDAIDLLWVPDPSSFIPILTDGVITFSTFNPFTDAEIERIVNWIKFQNGAMLVDFNGRYVQEYNGTSISTGNNVSSLNRLFSNFGFQADNSPIENPITTVFHPSGSPGSDHPILEDVIRITHLGSLFEITQPSSALTGLFTSLDPEGSKVPVIAYESNRGGGKAAFLHSNFPMDNVGTDEGYPSDSNGTIIETTNFQFIKNTFTWLLTPPSYVATELEVNSNNASLVDVHLTHQSGGEQSDIRRLHWLQLNLEYSESSSAFQTNTGFSEIQTGLSVSKVDGEVGAYSKSLILNDSGYYRITTTLKDITHNTLWIYKGSNSLQSYNNDLFISTNAENEDSFYLSEEILLYTSESENIQDISFYLNGTQASITKESSVAGSVYSFSVDQDVVSNGTYSFVAVVEYSSGNIATLEKTVSFILIPRPIVVDFNIVNLQEIKLGFEILIDVNPESSSYEIHLAIDGSKRSLTSLGNHQYSYTISSLDSAGTKNITVWVEMGEETTTLSEIVIILEGMTTGSSSTSLEASDITDEQNLTTEEVNLAASSFHWYLTFVSFLIFLFSVMVYVRVRSMKKFV